MRLGRDFRLPTDVRPRRYALGFDLDLDAWTFRGAERIELELERPRAELYLHAADIEIARALARAGGREVAAELTWDHEADVVALRFPETLEGRCSLELEFSGPIRPDLRAIYRTTRGQERYAVTQFQAIDARRAFPCFDEPAFKARFALELSGPSELVAIANTSPLETADAGAGRTRWRFAETLPISSYLVAFAVGPFESTETVRMKSGVPVRVWLPRGLAADGVYARDVHREATEWLEDYTGIPYPYDKVEALGIPDFAAGAMENPGAVTYRLYVLAANPAKASTTVLKQCFEYAAHELTHMWWGDLVTFAWWDDIWLNESFATFVGHKANDALRPDWRVWRDFLLRVQLRNTFGIDALESTHPISMPARTAEEATQRFDAISYEKAACVLRMLETFVGQEPFRRGVRIYLERFRESNASAADFWRALDEASGRDATRVASAWITQSGHPIVDVRLVREGTLSLRQRRFFTDPAAAETAQRWPIPLILRTGAGEVKTLLDAAEGSVDVAPQTWIFPNARAMGFYRYALDGTLRARLLPHVRALDALERFGLLDNDWALLRAGVLRAGDYIALVRAFEGEDDRAVLSALYEQLRWLGEQAVDGATREAFANLVARIFRPQLERLGWEAKPDDDEDDQQLRPIAIRALGQIARLPEVREEAARRIRAHLDGVTQDRNVVAALAAVAAIDGDEELHRRYVARMRAVELADPNEESRFRAALAAFERPGAARLTIAACFDGTIRDQDFRFILADALRTPAVRLDYWRAIREHWDEKIAPLEVSLRNAIVIALSQLCLAAVMSSVREFLLAKQREDSSEVTAQAIETLRLDTAAARRIAGELSAALAPERSLPR